MKKKTFYTELAYLFGIALIALGVAFSEKADFGFSMVAAPAYLLYRWLNPIWSFVTFGFAEYVFQAFLVLLIIVILRRVHWSYLASFGTAVLYGFILDGFVWLLGGLPAELFWQRAIWFVLGVVITAAGVSLAFKTYIPPEAYELFVMEFSRHFHIEIHKCKRVYDFTSCAVAVVMSFLIFGLWHFEGVKLGTLIITLVNSSAIALFTKLFERYFVFRDGLPWRTFFTGEEKRV